MMIRYHDYDNLRHSASELHARTVTQVNVIRVTSASCFEENILTLRRTQTFRLIKNSNTDCNVGDLNKPVMQFHQNRLLKHAS